MRYVYLIIASIILVYCNSCTIGKQVSSMNVEENLYWRVNDFYDAYLRYPETLDELSDFIWQIVNAEYEYKSFDLYLKSAPPIFTRDAKTLDFILNNRDKMHMAQKQGRLIITYKHKKIEIQKNVCKDLEMPLEKSHFIYKLNTCEIFDSDGRIMRNYYNDDFIELLTSVKKQYLCKHPNIDVNKLIYSAFRYNKHDGLVMLCPQVKVNIKNNLYLKDLSFSLDTFINERDINIIQFIIGVPNEKK